MSMLCLPELLLPVAPGPAEGHYRPMSPPETPKHSQASPAHVSCGATAPFSWVLVHTRFFLCPPRVSVLLVLWNLYNQNLLTFKIKYPGDSQCVCQIPRLGSLMWGLEPWHQCENFFGTVALQLVGHPPGGSMVGLMVTSSRRT